MNTAEKIAVMQAFEDGEKIEYRIVNGVDWKLMGQPEWDWVYGDYRIKPEPKPATLEDRVKAEYGDYEVVMLEMTGDYLKYKSANGTHLHVDAQSKLGFYRYIFEYEGPGNKLFTWIDPVHQHTNHTQMPIAVLFSGGEK